MVEVLDGVIDFGVQEQVVVNNWSGSADPEATSRQVSGWLDRGLVTEADLTALPEAVREEELRAAYVRALTQIREAALAPSVRVLLDLCTGMGALFAEAAFVRALRERTVLLTDLSRVALTRARTRLGPDEAARLSFLACNARRLPIADASVDLVTTVAGLQNAESAGEVIAEAKRVLRPSGKLMSVATFVAEGSRSLRLSDHLGFGAAATRTRMAAVMERTGFTDVSLYAVFQGVAHEKGDLMPLKGDDIEVRVMEATPGTITD
jgi:SAM-dependent methyltransferase